MNRVNFHFQTNYLLLFSILVELLDYNGDIIIMLTFTITMTGFKSYKEK